MKYFIALQMRAQKDDTIAEIRGKGKISSSINGREVGRSEFQFSHQIFLDEGGGQWHCFKVQRDGRTFYAERGAYTNADLATLEPERVQALQFFLDLSRQCSQRQNVSIVELESEKFAPSVQDLLFRLCWKKAYE